jgi:hypothetical protein
MWKCIAVPAQTVDCGSPWSLFLGFFSAALVAWVVLVGDTC